MMADPNGGRRPIQFWVAVASIGGIVLTTLLLIGSVTALAIFGTEGRAQSDTLNNGLLLALGGLVGLSGTVGAYLFSRGAQGEPIPLPFQAPPMQAGETRTMTTHKDADEPASTGGAP
jgi:hypothetical protein